MKTRRLVARILCNARQSGTQRTRVTSPGRMELSVWRASGTKGSKSLKRLVGAQRIRTETLRAAKFWRSGMFRSTAMTTLKLSDSAASSRRPFFSPAKPANRTVWQL
jgi:hypothetical protein